MMLRIRVGPLLTSGVTSILLFCASAHAQVQTAGTLFIDVDATSVSVGAINVITNRGSLGGVFEARGAAATVPRVALAGSSGTRGVQFDGADYMQHAVAPGGVLVPAPAGVTAWRARPACELAPRRVAAAGAGARLPPSRGGAARSG